ncbi:cupin domain-containing protein [Patulibacter sp. SYSU D01012]|uniref:cupin domain-containing protein n=1 Tax=Patulibacter sp. SYSU D01012 TaxID=2817381 RepID=UPI001B308085|nr:cupin domain-containing protein [Patulibacter sp. SYSU D01012]
MRRVNLDTATPEADATDPDGFRALMARVGPSLGAKGTGASLYVLPPGQAVCPYHYEYAEEEWLLVLQGRATVRTPAGEETCGPMDLVFFPTGPEGAHQVRNATDEEVRVLLWSTVVHPAATAYPDSGKVGLYTGVPGEDLIAHRRDGVGYWSGEPGVEA